MLTQLCEHVALLVTRVREVRCSLLAGCRRRCTVLVDRSLDLFKQLVNAERLVEHGFQSQLACLDDRVPRVIAETRHQNDRQIFVDFAYLAETFISGHIRQADIREDGVVIETANHEESLFAVVSSLDFASETSQQFVSCAADGIVVVCYEHPF